MKPAPFEYAAPQTIDEALALLDHGQPGARRRPEPRAAAELPPGAARRGSSTSTASTTSPTARADGDALRIGALTRQVDARALGLVARALAAAEPGRAPESATRRSATRGTIGGSVAHADPAAELPVALTALDARFHLRSARGARVLTAGELFLGAAYHGQGAGRAARRDRGPAAARRAPARRSPSTRPPTATSPRPGRPSAVAPRRTPAIALLGAGSDARARARRREGARWTAPTPREAARAGRRRRRRRLPPRALTELVAPGDRGGTGVRIAVEINGEGARRRGRAAHAAVGLHPPRARA